MQKVFSSSFPFWRCLGKVVSIFLVSCIHCQRIEIFGMVNFNALNHSTIFPCERRYHGQNKSTFRYPPTQKMSPRYWNIRAKTTVLCFCCEELRSSPSKSWQNASLRLNALWVVPFLYLSILGFCSSFLLGRETINMYYSQNRFIFSERINLNMLIVNIRPKRAVHPISSSWHQCLLLFFAL